VAVGLDLLAQGVDLGFEGVDSIEVVVEFPGEFDFRFEPGEVEEVLAEAEEADFCGFGEVGLASSLMGFDVVFELRQPGLDVEVAEMDAGDLPQDRLFCRGVTLLFFRMEAISPRWQGRTAEMMDPEVFDLLPTQNPIRRGQRRQDLRGKWKNQKQQSQQALHPSCDVFRVEDIHLDFQWPGAATR
jgi:hypothetical protein